MQHDDLNATYEAYVEDMQMLQSLGWLSSETRSVSLSFTLYNPNHDFWCANFYHISISPSGIFTPWSDVELFRPVFDEGLSVGQEIFPFEILRILCMLQVGLQISRDMRVGRKSGLTQLLQPKSLVDVLIIVSFIWLCIIRAGGMFIGSSGAKMVARHRLGSGTCLGQYFITN